MRCERCGFDSPDGFAFCGKCGRPLSAQPEGLIPADLDHLRRYLPTSLVEALQYDLRSPSPVRLEQCQSHLTQLLKTTASHLPAYLVERVARDPTPGRIGGQFLHGTLLFADISGFTAMSEKLSRLRREGAEEITVIVNRYFGVMLDVLRAHDGQLIKFGGDALLGLFPEPPAESATRAAQAALHMQAAIRDFAETHTSQGTFPLQMKVGLRRGQFFAAELGTARGMEYALLGADVNATAVAESAASAGQILLDQDTLAALSLPCRAVPGPAGYLLLEQLEDQPAEPAQVHSRRLSASHLPQEAAGALRSVPPTDLFDPAGLTEPSLANLRQLTKLLDALTPYLPAGLLARINWDTHALQFEGEHRLVAILFANVVGLGEIADRLGPGQEDQIVAALNRYFIAMENALQQFGGVINKIDLSGYGDKLLAFFGAPAAHEDDTERAVRAAWAMQAAITDFGVQSTDAVPLAIRQRIGLSYGYAFAGYMGTDWRHEYTVMGDEVNLAARLMSVAEEGRITVSSNVMRKVRGLFNLTSRGSVSLKGKSEPFHIFAVDGPRDIPEPVRGLEHFRSPLVGREAEWRRLLAAAEQLFAGRGQIVSVTGEAGLGKTRLVAELRQKLKKDIGDIGWVEGHCLSYTESVSYLPFQEIVRQLIGLRVDDSEFVTLGKVQEALAARLPPDDAQTTLPYVANFLGLPLDEALREKVRYLDAEALQRRTFLALSHLLEAYATSKTQPLVVVVDDIHWMDQASLALLEYLLPLADHCPLLFLLLYRLERHKGCWRIHEQAAREFPHCTAEIELQCLTPDGSLQLLNHLISTEAWPSPLRDLVFRRCEGNPLYVEETLRIFVDKKILRQDGNGAWQLVGDGLSAQIPDTLQGVMMTRLDALDEPPRRTAQVASVVGRTFPFDVLAAIASETEAELNPHLARLQQHEIVHETRRSPELAYAFKHGLMQEVCYESMLASSRRGYHRQIAVNLEAHLAPGSSDAETTLPLVAHHAFAGQDWPRALQYQTLAGQQAQKLFANAAAIDHFTKALQSAEGLPSIETGEQRLLIHAALGELFTTTGQYEAGMEHLGRARALAAERGHAEAEARACRWCARSYELRGDYVPAFEWIEQGLAALAGRETAEAAQLRLLAGLIHVRQGRLDQAQEQGQAALHLAEQQSELAVLARANLLLALIHLQHGESRSAIELTQQALALYRRVGDLAGQATAHNQLGSANINIGEWPAAEQAYRQAHRLFSQMGDVYNRAFADNNLGEIALNQGRLEEAVQFYQAALHSLEQIGGSAYVLGALHNNLGAALIGRGQVEAARQQLRQSQALFEQAQARDFLPELYQHWAEAALADGNLVEAETQAQQSLVLARELDMQREVAITLRLLGEIALADRNRQDACSQGESQLRESLALLERLDEPYQAARTQLALARVLAACGQSEAARAALENCVKVFERLKATPDLAATRNLLAACG